MKYIEIVERDVRQVGKFDMERTFFCNMPASTCCGGMSPNSITERTMGVYRAVTVAYTLIVCGEEKGFVIQSGLIHETKKSGRNIHGLVVGPLGNMSKTQQDKMMLCLENDIAFLRREMWYAFENTSQQTS